MVQREVADRFFAVAADEGVRRRLGARPARDRAHRLPSRLARGLPAAAERRLGARRVPAHRARRELRSVKRVVEGAFAHRRKTLANSLALAGVALARARGRGARRDRPRPPTCAPRRSRRPSSSRSRRRSRDRARAGEDQPRARRRPAARDGQHELATVYQRVDLADRISRRAGGATDRRRASRDDTIVARALDALAARRRRAGWRVAIDKRIPVAAGLGGGSSDAATALRLANEQLAEPLAPRRAARARRRARRRRARSSSTTARSSATGDGTTLEPLDLPQDYAVAARAAARRERRRRRRDVYARVRRARRARTATTSARARLLDALAAVATPRDLAALPPNDLARSPLAAELVRAGAFRADVSGAGPTSTASSTTADAGARAARRAAAPRARSGSRYPAWYG